MNAAATAAKATHHGLDAVEYTQHARLVTVALQAFGDDPDAAFFVESLPPSVRIPRPDLVIAHLDLGILIIENKGVSLNEIVAIEADRMSVMRDGEAKWENPFLQAEKVMMRLKDLLRKRVAVSSIALNRMVALPRVGEQAFIGRFGEHWKFETVFSEAIEDPSDFRIYVKGFVQHKVPRLFEGSLISPRAVAELRSIFLGTASLAPRAPVVPVTAKPSAVEILKPSAAAPRTLGDQIREADSLPRRHTAQQQELLRSDARSGHRLFRGVAGSGKSVILAGLVGRFVRRTIDESPVSPRVLVCCFNRTLKHFLEDKIDTELARLCWEKPAEKSIAVVHFEELVRMLKHASPKLATELDFSRSADRAADINARLDAMPQSDRDALAYDAVFVDEAQDFEPAELELLRRLARMDGEGRQSLSIFYDNAQNIYGKLPPTWEHLGINIVGRTTYLDECLRNTSQTLELAFNVLIGACAPEGARATTRRFADLASLRSRGLISESDDRISVKFCRRTGTPPVVRTFEDRRSEMRWIVDEVERLVSKDGIAPSEILILHRSHRIHGPALPFQLGALAGKAGFAVRTVDAEHHAEKDAPLIQPNILTVSTIHSAKGYDAPVVMLVGADQIEPDTKGRAMFYVGATRARQLLYVTGVASSGAGLLAEAVQCIPAGVTTHS